MGGVVPTRYLPAVEKGLRETVTGGVLCGYPVVDLKAVVYDGSHHPVDSSEFAFKIAASMAFKAAFEKAKPLLLEPYYTLSVQTPEQYTGEIVGEISGKRGKNYRYGCGFPFSDHQCAYPAVFAPGLSYADGSPYTKQGTLQLLIQSLRRGAAGYGQSDCRFKRRGKGLTLKDTSTCLHSPTTLRRAGACPVGKRIVTSDEGEGVRC